MKGSFRPLQSAKDIWVELDLGDNAVRDWSQIEALGAAFPKLRRLVLRGNPVCQDE